MITLGVTGPPRGGHDSAACLVVDGRIVSFGEEERFLRIKHAVHKPPHRAVAFCLREAGISIEDVDVIAVGWDVARVIHQDGANLSWLNTRKYLQYLTGLEIALKTEIVFVSHHLAHATCAFYASPFPAAAVLIVDGIGEDRSVSIYSACAEAGLREVRTWGAAQSLGLLFDGACQSINLSMLEAGKLMGLAAFGRQGGIEPWPLVQIARDDYTLAMQEADESHSVIVGNWVKHFKKLHGGATVKQQRHTLDRDELAVRTAWSAQNCIEQVVMWLAQTSRRLTEKTQLCFGGGVALNCSANGLIPDPVFVPPIPHDSGVALGAAWFADPPRGKRQAFDPYLGQLSGAPQSLAKSGTWEPFDAGTICERLESGNIGGIIEGRAEIGPRALCHRSIIAWPTPASQQDRVNLVKRREPWRPFAPVALPQCDGVLWQSRMFLSQYMIGAIKICDVSANLIPAVVHIDGTTRPQIMNDENTAVGQILTRMSSDGVPPVLLNTSFNGPGQPIVNTEGDAVAAAKELGLDFLIVGDRMNLQPNV